MPFLAGIAFASFVGALGDSPHLRAHNFGAGPSALPDEVLKKAQAEFRDFGGSGMSVF
jgi:hypothetical protein